MVASGGYILIAGSYAATDAYPNVRYKVEDIKAFSGLPVVEINRSLHRRVDFRSGRGGGWRLLARGGSMLFASLSILRGVIRHRRAKALYIPYPALHLLCLLALVPRRLRPPRVVVDAFISLYDTAVVDRALWPERGWIARLLYRLERMAYRGADLLLVDTEENAEYLSGLFGLPRERIVACPLAINEEEYRPGPPPPAPASRMRVVFVGTLVPLHGVERLCEAIGRLDPALPVEFVLVGDGQQSPIVERFLQGRGAEEPSGVTVTWHREWMDSPELAGLIRSADLCIGILGHQGKADRVWPFKNYLYMACGKALVTADSRAARTVAGRCGDPSPFLRVEPDSALPLAELLADLVRRRDELPGIGRRARVCYEHTLSRAAGRGRLFELLLGRETGLAQDHRAVAGDGRSGLK